MEIPTQISQVLKMYKFNPTGKVNNWTVFIEQKSDGVIVVDTTRQRVHIFFKDEVFISDYDNLELSLFNLNQKVM